MHRFAPTTTPGTCRRRLVVLALLAALGVVGLSAEADEPGIDARCTLDACTIRSTYVLDEPADGHDVVIEWRTRPAAGFNGNDADVVRRATAAGVGRAVGDGPGFRYTVQDVIWHSDIRCDNTVEITVTRPGGPPIEHTLTKPVPDATRTPYCSDYGMSDEVEDPATSATG